MLTYFLQPRSCSFIRHNTRIKIVNPFLQRSLGNVIELVDLQNIILRIQLTHTIHLKRLFLKRSQFQHIVQMNAPKLSLAMIDEVLAMSQ